MQVHSASLGSLTRWMVKSDSLNAKVLVVSANLLVSSFLLAWADWINPDNSIVIDFSVPPKNGPKNFVGNWDENGIKFVRDGNKWPMVPKSH